MKRVMIIGCCGSGKSTLARKIASLTTLPIYHLDQYYWKPNWQETPKTEWESIVTSLADKPLWIIDGNYGGTLDIRRTRADTIIYMDVPTTICLYRVVKRIITYYGKVRPDMPTGCRERFDAEFLHYVATYRLLRHKAMMKMMHSLPSHQQGIIIRNNQDVENLLSSVAKPI